MDASITYLGDWTAELFAENWAEKDAQAPDSDPVRFPMVVPKETYDEYGLQPGDSMGVACKGCWRAHPQRRGRRPAPGSWPGLR